MRASQHNQAVARTPGELALSVGGQRTFCRPVCTRTTRQDGSAVAMKVRRTLAHRYATQRTISEALANDLPL
jgi:hypothetical protein